MRGLAAVAAVSSFIDGAIDAGLVTREQVRRLLSAGWVPYVAWRRGDVAGVTTGEAVRSLDETETADKLRARGICPQCRAVTPNHSPGRGLRHREDCKSWGR